MKRFTLIFLLFLSGTVFAGPSIPDMEKTALSTKDYRLFYNLGVIYASTNDAGASILNLKRAYLLNPYDKETKRTLNKLRESIGIPSYLFDQSPLEKLILLPFSLFPINTDFVIGFILLALGSLVFSFLLSKLDIPVVRPFMKYQKPARTAAIVLITLGLVYIASSVLRNNTLFDPKNAVVMNASDIKDRPDVNAIKIVSVPAGLECIIVKESLAYYLINTIDGHEGWIARTNLSRLWEGGQ